jgi:PAS domain S-box-containing protein
MSKIRWVDPMLTDRGTTPEDVDLRVILEGTATETGERFFQVLVESLAKALGTLGAWVTEYLPEERRLHALAFWLNGKFIPWDRAIDGTPCEQVVIENRLVHVPDRLLEYFKGDPDVRATGAVSYLGIPLQGASGEVLGHLAILDKRPMPESPRAVALFRIFANRASAELRRLQSEREVREREEKLARLLDSAMDAILELDTGLRVTRMNPAAEKAFACRAGGVLGQEFGRFLTGESIARLQELVRTLEGRGERDRSLWVPGGFHARRANGDPFHAEATLSCFELDGEHYYSLILRNVEDRLASERAIQSLTVQTEYLREEIRELQNAGEILGRSAAMAQVLEEVRQVAGTDATVLITGETGTGKELVARAIHQASPRRSGPLIKLNCGAIPANLIESELFGHEKGAFTGAAARRDGRFAMADKGTIFLDEVGELPADVQVKLLRVLQESEFEPVGGDRTRKVDVRVIAATNRDLEAMTREGKFRQDHYYRLSVFPIRVPPLRDRGDDVALLAQSFADRCAQKFRRTFEPLPPPVVERLKRYEWPGNVRELQNVIERAAITARGACLNFERALPDSARESAPAESGAIKTVAELEALERENILRALEAAAWKISGDAGAASLLGMNPSTLTSRMKALGIRRPS